jgi:hypothetical protein
VNRSRWLPIAGLDQALLMVTLDIFEYLEVVHKRQRRNSSLDMLTPIGFENAFTVAWRIQPRGSTKPGAQHSSGEPGAVQSSGGKAKLWPKKR